MAIAPQLNFPDTFVSKNGVKPRYRIQQTVYGNATHIMWLTIGLTEDDTFLLDTTGLEGISYPAARSEHSDTNWKNVITGKAQSDSSDVILLSPRVPTNTNNWTKLLSANTEYTIHGWVEHTDHEGNVNLYQRTIGVITTVSDAITYGGGIDPEYKGNGMNEYTLKDIDTKNCSAKIIHEQHILGSGIDATSYEWANAVEENLRGHIRYDGATTLVETRQGTTSSNEARQYWRLKIKNLVTDEVVIFPSNTTTYDFYQTAFVNPVSINTARMVTVDSFAIYCDVQESRCSDAHVTFQVATNAAFTANLIDHTSANLLVGEPQGNIVEATVLSGAELLNGERRFCEGSNLTSATTYYVRAKMWSTNVPLSIVYSETRVFTTTASNLAVKTPAKHQVGYFFQGNFTAYKKLSKIDMPEFSPSWKSACVINGVAYLGNVKYIDTDGSTVRKPDRILKSLPFQVDTFTKYNYIDVAVEDGDDIIALNYIGEKLLQFKKNKLYVINVGSEYEYLEATYDGVGVSSTSAVCKLPYGVAFTNRSGCYIYDGNKIINLLQKEDRHVINKKVWYDFISDFSMISYIQEKNILLVTDSSGSASSGNCYIFDIDAKGWIYYKAGLPASYKTNFITDTTGRSLFASGLSGHYYYPQIDEGGNDEFAYQTGELDFGDPTSLKKIYSITVSYANAGMSNQPILTYSTDSGKTFHQTERGSFRNHNVNTGWYDASFKLQSPSTVTYNYPTCHTLILKVSTMNIAEGYTNFQLNEINVEFRKIHKRLTASTLDTSTIITGTTGNPLVSDADKTSVTGPVAD